MPRYLRAKGSIFFFTVVLAHRPNTLLIDEINRLRHVYKIVQQRHPFETVSICILPDHIHALWGLPEGDANFHPLELDQERLLKGSRRTSAFAEQGQQARKGNLAAALLGTCDPR